MENFEIIQKLGEGGFSRVYKVRRKEDNQIYALKKVQITNLSEKQKLNSLNEIRVLASINNKYIVNYKDSFLDSKDSSLCLVMEYADNGDLSKLIQEYKKSNKYFNEKEIWRIFIQIVKGLKSLHDLNIIHRDIKSSNIFLFSDGTAKLGDLNVCKILSVDNLGKTQAGTPSFAAPEVWMEKPYGLKSDIWSLGCVLYEMAALKCPFSSNNAVELNNKILVGNFKRIPKIFSNDLNCIIEHMIRFEPEKRISCKEILECDIILKKMLIIKEADSDDNYRNNNDESDDNEEKQKLLGTIYIPNNLLYLNHQLPKPNYSQEIKFSFKNSKILNPIKLKSGIKPIFSNQNYNKSNSDGKLLHLIGVKRNSENSKLKNNLNTLFNKDPNKNKREININESSRIIKGPIKLNRIISNLSSMNEVNKNNKEFPSEKIINKININNFSSLNLDEIRRKENKLFSKEILDLKSLQIYEKEKEREHYLDSDRFKEILFNKKKRKSHGHKKDYKFIVKERNENDFTEKKNINNRYNVINNNNDYKQIPTDVNISDNDNKLNKYQSSPIKLDYKINSNNKHFSNKCLGKYIFKKDKNDFRINLIKKERNINIRNSFLPLLKSSCNRNFDD